MARAPSGPPSAVLAVERFFQFSLLGLVASGYLAVAGSGYLDLPTVILTACGLLLRALVVTGAIRLHIPPRLTTSLALAYAGFYPVDYFWISGGVLEATVHLVFFLAVLQILTANSPRAYLFTAIIAFLELLAGALLSVNLSFFVFLALYLLFTAAAFISSEIRRAMDYRQQIARMPVRNFSPRLAFAAFALTMGILTLTAGLFFLLPRTADAALRHLVSHSYYLPGFSNQVNLGAIGEVKTRSTAVMHVRFYGDEKEGNLKWRGGG
ncbi:MAG: transglutaminaseTgpA domain-containing protein, partial [Bryobacteraceae bacterium]